MQIEPCFCGNTDPDEFIIRHNKMACLCCPTIRTSSTTRTADEMLAVWNTRGVAPIDAADANAKLFEEAKGDVETFLWKHNPCEIQSNELGRLLKSFCDFKAKQLREPSHDTTK